MTTSSEIVFAIIDDILGRKGLGDQWDELDLDIQEEIIDEWKEIVEAILPQDG